MTTGEMKIAKNLEMLNNTIKVFIKAFIMDCQNKERIMSNFDALYDDEEFDKLLITLDE